MTLGSIYGGLMKHVHSKGFNEKELYGAYKIFFGTLVSESRLKIMNLLMKGDRNVSEIVKELEIDQTAVSHDLTRLKRCGFVKSEVKGKFRFYNLNEDIKQIMKLINEHMAKYCVHILKGER